MTHEEVLEYLNGLNQAGLLGQSYLLFGENKASLSSLAGKFAAHLEGAERGSGSPLLDFKVVNSFGDSLGIDLIREIKKFLWQTPVRSDRRFVFVERGELLTAQAQNAMLKISEEPPSRALIFLSANNIHRLLPTVVSRFQSIYISDSACEPEDKEISGLVKNFLSGENRWRSEIIKQIVEKNGDGNDRVLDFLDQLIFELGKNKIANAGKLSLILSRRELIGRYSLNKRLQLEFISSIL